MIQFLQVALYLVMGAAVAAFVGGAIYLLFFHNKAGATAKTAMENNVGRLALLVAALIAIYIGSGIVIGHTEWLKWVVGPVVYIAGLLLGFKMAAGSTRKTMTAALMTLVASLFGSALFLMFSSGGHDTVPLRDAKVDLADQQSLQRGAQVFRDYCLSCHGLSAVRYNQLTKLGISEDEIKRQMLTTSDKVGDLMQVSMKREDAATWFGVPPPDLSLVASARKPDWIYTYLLSFYRDDNRPTGWNNALFPNVGMPHALWTEEGVKTAKIVDVVDEHTGAKAQHFEGFEIQKEGKLNAESYEKMAHDVTNFLVWASEPDQLMRKRIGYGVLAFLFIFLVVVRRLSKNYWKDIK